MEMKQNFLMAFILSGLLLLSYWVFVGRPYAERTRAETELEQTSPTPSPVTTPPSIKPLQSRAEALNPADTPNKRILIDTPSLKGSFRIHDNRFDDLQLKAYKTSLESNSTQVQLLTPQEAPQAAYVYDSWTTQILPSSSIIWQHIRGETLTPQTPVQLMYENTHVRIERTIQIDDGYLITLTDQISNLSHMPITLQRTGITRQHDLPEGLSNFFILQEGPIAFVGGGLKDTKYKKVRDKKRIQENGESGWVGLTDKYWLIAAIPPQEQNMQVQFAYQQLDGRDVYEAGYQLDTLTLSSGHSLASTAYIYAGAKERQRLETYSKTHNISRLDLAIDWGTMGILVRPMSTALTFLGRKSGNFGLGILILTLIIKILLFPLFNKQYESQAKLKKVQPKLQKLQSRYKDDRLKLQQEMMALYRKEGVNPMAGCLPILPTIFIFFALYKTVFINVDLRHAPFFGWIRDLSAKDPLSVLNGFGLLPWEGIPAGFLAFFAIGPLAILYGISMAMIYTLTPTTTGGGEHAEMMQKIMKFMPWIFMFILAPFASGLLLYWVWNNILSFIQQYYITRKFNVDTPINAFWRKFRAQTPKEKAHDAAND